MSIYTTGVYIRLKEKITAKTEVETSSFCEPIENYAQYLNTYKYIYRNPVEAGLSLKAENYIYSTLNILLGRSLAYCEIIDYASLIQNPLQILSWLNNKSEFKTIFKRLYF